MPGRVVSLQPSVTQILELLGLQDRLVACTRHCGQVSNVGPGIPVIEDSWTAQSHQIVAARPDLVIAAVPFQASAVEEILKSGARFLALAPRNLSDIYEDIAVIAQLFGRARKGEAVIRGMMREMEGIRERARASQEGRRGKKARGGGKISRARNSQPTTRNSQLVYCEEWGKPLICSQRWVAELVEAAAGCFLGEPSKQIAAGDVAAADPDVVVMAWCGAGDRVPLKKVIAGRKWQGLRAVRARRVYCIRDELLTTPAPVLIKGLRALAAAIHPEIFGEVAEGLRRME